MDNQFPNTHCVQLTKFTNSQNTISFLNLKRRDWFNQKPINRCQKLLFFRPTCLSSLLYFVEKPKIKSWRRDIKSSAFEKRQLTWELMMERELLDRKTVNTKAFSTSATWNRGFAMSAAIYVAASWTTRAGIGGHWGISGGSVEGACSGAVTAPRPRLWAVNNVVATDTPVRWWKSPNGTAETIRFPHR
jgi:hypothetical protein